MGREDQVVSPPWMDVAGLGNQRHNDMEAAGRAHMPRPTSPLSEEGLNTMCGVAPALVVSLSLLCCLPLCSQRL